MKKPHTALLLLALLLPLATLAQQSLTDINGRRELSASNYLAYPGPLQRQLTPAPEGYEPCYISHYGRHGSRFLIDTMDYVRPINILAKAEAEGKLTDMGCDVLDKVRAMYRESHKRWGELTLLGAQQHRDIARRMMQRFPEVFRDTAHVDARSTVVIRCILSMTNCLMQLQAMNPLLKISHDASDFDMYYMNQPDRSLDSVRRNSPKREILRQWDEEHLHPSRLIKALFGSADYIADHREACRLYHELFQLASIVQNSEIRHRLSLYDIFTPEELYEVWQRENVRWFLDFGNSDLTGRRLPFSQRNLLRNIIATADSCLRQPVPGATLRFGHETMVLPLTCLMELDNFGKCINDVTTLESEGWLNYRIFPMGANIQMVFYRKPGAPVLVKVLLNENETRLPVTPVTGPYCRWDELRAYYLAKLNAYK